MTGLQNDTHDPTEERGLIPFSQWDLVIPIAIFAAVSVLLCLAFQSATDDEIPEPRIPIAQEDTATLIQRQRTLEVAIELIRRNDVSFETADSCLSRIASLQSTDISEVSAQAIRALSNDIPNATQQRWAALLKKHVGIDLTDSLTGDSPQNRPIARRIAWAALLIGSSEQVPAIFEKAAQDTQDMRTLLQSIPIVADHKINQDCFLEVQKWILNPVSQNSDTTSTRTILAAIDCVAEMQIDDRVKTTALCELAVAGVCRAECFQHLQKLGVDSLPPHLRGSVASALLDHLAIRSKPPRTIRAHSSWAFADDLAEVFDGHRRKRFQYRVAEIRSQK